MSVSAATNKNITKKDAQKIINDISEYLVEQTLLGKECPKATLDVYTCTQMGCMLAGKEKPYKAKKVLKVKRNTCELLSIADSKKEKLSKGECYRKLVSVKNSDVKRNVKNLFGKNTVKFRKKTNFRYVLFLYTYFGDGNMSYTTYPGGHFRIQGQRAKCVAKISKITGKTVKKVTFTVGSEYEGDFMKRGTYTVTLKPAKNKYKCIITGLKERWRTDDNAYIM